MEMVKTNIPYCIKCKYGRSNNVGRFDGCMYYLETGNDRGCPVGYCDKFEPRTNKRIKKGITYGKRRG